MAISFEEYEKLDPIAWVDINNVRLKFSVPNRTAKWRVDSLLTKEPDTIQWLSTFEQSDTFVDVGANVGMYSIYAAVVRGVSVYAFEPESQNYALLNKNIYLNNIGSKLTAYCIGLSNVVGVTTLNLSNFSPGDSCHSLGDEVGFDLKPRPSAFKQGAIVSTLDELVEAGAIPVPQHIKIDVDGIEHKVVEGAKVVLTNPAIKSLLIEVNPQLEEHQQLLAHLEQLGYFYNPAQAKAAARKDGPFKGVGEIIFSKTSSL